MMPNNARRFSFAFAIAFILALEICLRIAGFDNPPLYVPDPEIGYMLKAGQKGGMLGKHFHYNVYHQRSEEPSKEAAYRVLMLGDSVVNGGLETGQDETITELLKRKLDQRLSVKGEVLNCAAPSWAIFNQAAYVKRFGIFGAQIVIWELGTHDLLQLKSALPSQGDREHPVKKPATAIGGMLRALLLPRAAQKEASQAFLQNDPGTKNMDKKWDKQFKPEILRVIDAVEYGKARLLVILIPARREMDREPTTFWKERICKVFDERGTAYINLLKIKGWRKEYYRDDIHLNKEGNEFVADLLFRWITEHGYEGFQ